MRRALLLRHAVIVGGGLALLACRPNVEAHAPSGLCSLRVSSAEPLRLPPNLAALPLSAYGNSFSGLIRFGRLDEPQWLADPADWRSAPHTVATVSEVWTATRRVGTVYASPGPGIDLATADRATASPWRLVASGHDAFITVIAAVEAAQGATVVVGVAAEPNVMKSVRTLIVDASGKAGSPRIVVPASQLGTVRTARAADGSVAIAWAVAHRAPSEPGSSLGLARLSAETGELIGSPFAVDADPTLAADAAELELAADGTGIALAFAARGARQAPREGGEVPLELRVFRQASAFEAPRRVASIDLSTQRDLHSYATDPLVPIALASAALQGRALFMWRRVHEESAWSAVLAGDPSPSVVRVPRETWPALRTTGPGAASLLMWRYGAGGEAHQQMKLQCQ